VQASPKVCQPAARMGQTGLARVANPAGRLISDR